MLDSMKEKYSEKQELDREWLILLTIAKQKGLSVQQVRTFLKQKVVMD
ncbi:hypothetical protein ACTWP4_04490 [Gracilibacillus sp. D59]